MRLDSLCGKGHSTGQGQVKSQSRTDGLEISSLEVNVCTARFSCGMCVFCRSVFLLSVWLLKKEFYFPIQH